MQMQSNIKIIFYETIPVHVLLHYASDMSIVITDTENKIQSAQIEFQCGVKGSPS